SVVVFQCPAGAWSCTRLPAGARPYRRVMLVFAPVSSMKTSLRASKEGARHFHCSRSARTSSRFCSSAARSFFFVPLADSCQRAMDRGQVAVQVQLFSQLLERGVGLLAHELDEPLFELAPEQALAASAVVHGFDAAGALALSHQLGDEGARDFEAIGDLLISLLTLVTDGEDALAQV